MNLYTLITLDPGSKQLEIWILSCMVDLKPKNFGARSVHGPRVQCESQVGGAGADHLTLGLVFVCLWKFNANHTVWRTMVTGAWKCSLANCATDSVLFWGNDHRFRVRYGQSLPAGCSACRELCVRDAGWGCWSSFAPPLPRSPPPPKRCCLLQGLTDNCAVLLRRFWINECDVQNSSKDLLLFCPITAQIYFPSVYNRKESWRETRAKCPFSLQTWI